MNVDRPLFCGSPDGQVVYVNDNMVMAVVMDIVDGVGEIKKPERLFNAEEVGVRLLGEYLEPAYDVAKNGERFVVIQRRFNSTITMVENWPEEYRTIHSIP